MSKSITALSLIKSIRKKWTRRPVTQIKKSKTGYNRQRDKKKVERDVKG